MIKNKVIETLFCVDYNALPNIVTYDCINYNIF